MISVVITSHHDEEGLYLTYFAAKRQLDMVQHEIIIVADGGTPVKWEKQDATRCFRGTFGSPQASRDYGIRKARGSSVVVLESHVIVSDIVLLVKDHDDTGATLTFPVRIAEGPEQFNVYGQHTDWDGNLWHKQLIYQPINQITPYRTSQFGNSCFVVDRIWYIKNGGYTELMKGWGGEEPFICLKAWMLGGTCWQTPLVWHAHHLTVGAHGDSMVSADYARNFAILKYVITGKVASGFSPSPEVEEERKRICAGPFEGDVNKLREYFRSENITN